jgi:nucleoid DNA-binding protein
MLKRDLVVAVAKKTGNTIKDITPIVDEVFNTILETLANDEDVKIVEFGNFKVKHRAERVGVNPTNRDKMIIPAKKVLDFVASGNMKRMIANGITDEITEEE